ncbi:ribonuclease III domain-containing protein [Gigaspora rosea]|uniref:Ribonuclease III domain-containing protein n=1 Tax=Gigaspora rosea TaxID=44941 RepID=A0A397UGA3_9GLOM|nr:ribonuclease III domain-containing protein [Gigaspora rosea]
MIKDIADHIEKEFNKLIWAFIKNEATKKIRYFYNNYINTIFISLIIFCIVIYIYFKALPKKKTIKQWKFKNHHLRIKALTNYFNNDHNNERLAFLGNSIIDNIVSYYLFCCIPKCKIYTLVYLKQKFLDKVTLAGFFRKLKLEKNLILDKENEMDRYINDNIHGESFKAYIAAIYLDCKCDFDKVLDYMKPFLTSFIEQWAEILEDTEDNNEIPSELEHVVKLDLQILKKGLEEPIYQWKNNGLHIHNNIFIYEVLVNGKIYGTGEGKKKNEAKKHAAIQAFDNIINNKSDSVKSDNIKSDSIKSDSVKSDSIKSDSVKSDVIKSDSIKSDVVKSDSIKSDVVKSDSIKSDVVKSDSIKSVCVKSDSVKSDSVKSDSVKPDGVKSDNVKPDDVKSDNVKSDNVKPDSVNIVG